MKRQALFTFIITLMLASLLCIPMFAYTVNIGGVLLNRSGHGVEGKIIVVKSSSNSSFHLDTSIMTDSGGYFSISLETRDDIVRGAFTLFVEGCTTAQSTASIHYDSKHRDVKVRLLDCQDPSQRCFADIVANRVDSTLVELTASHQGHDGATYHWSTGDTSRSIQVTEPGSYCVRIQDTSGCIIGDCILIGNPECLTQIHVSRSGNATDVASNNASILTARTKGMAPFSYKWSTGDTSKQTSALTTDLYCVTVVDASGCRSNDCKKVEGPNCRATIIVDRQDSANTSASASLSVRMSGTPPLSYLWSTGDTTSVILAGDATWYCVSVSDSLGCVARDCINLAQRSCKTSIRIASISSDAVGSGQKVLYAVSKGIPPFHYRWSTGDTTQRIMIDTAGEYCVKVIDAHGCASSSCIKVRFQEPCKVKIQLAVSNSQISDQISSEWLLVARTHGRPPFSYRWSTGDTTRHISISDALQYCVTVTDAADCVVNDCLDLSKYADSCTLEIHHSRNGRLVALPRPQFATSFAWNTGDTTRSIKIDSAGEYCVTVHNIFGCTASACIAITNEIDALCKVKIIRRKVEEGTLLIAATRWGEDFTFEWSTGDTSRYILVDSAGLYCVSASTENCSVQACTKVDQFIAVKEIGHGMGYPKWARQKQTKAFPNPFNQLFNLQVTVEELHEIEIFIHRFDGKIVWQGRRDLEAGINTLPIDLKNMAAGIYLVNLYGKELHETLRMVKY
ncbi:MAG: T9SS type A sorting domain-containing protein [Saprospiraceae bacterium]|nr:T9SS type A sorting domain-containing protein [Saprospiraceae bacterium]